MSDTTTLPRRTVAAMARVCWACPVRIACAAHADAINATGGFWAGTDRAIEQLPLFSVSSTASAFRARTDRKSA